MNTMELIRLVKDAATLGIDLSNEADAEDYLLVKEFMSAYNKPLDAKLYKSALPIVKNGYTTLLNLGEWCKPYPLMPTQVLDKLVSMDIVEYDTENKGYKPTKITERFSMLEDDKRVYTSRLLHIINGDFSHKSCWLTKEELLCALGVTEETVVGFDTITTKYKEMVLDGTLYHIMLLAAFPLQENKEEVGAKRYIYRVSDIAVMHKTSSAVISKLLVSYGFINKERTDLTDVGKSHGVKLNNTFFFSKSILPLVHEMLAQDQVMFVTAKVLAKQAGVSSMKLHGACLALGLLEGSNKSIGYVPTAAALSHNLIRGKYRLRYSKKLAELIINYYKKA